MLNVTLKGQWSQFRRQAEGVWRKLYKEKKRWKENLANKRDNHWEGKIRKSYSSCVCLSKGRFEKANTASPFLRIYYTMVTSWISGACTSHLFSRKAFLRRGRFRGILRFNRKPMIELLGREGGWRVRKWSVTPAIAAIDVISNQGPWTEYKVDKVVLFGAIKFTKPNWRRYSAAKISKLQSLILCLWYAFFHVCVFRVRL